MVLIPEGLEGQPECPLTLGGKLRVLYDAGRCFTVTVSMAFIRVPVLRSFRTWSPTLLQTIHGKSPDEYYEASGACVNAVVNQTFFTQVF